MLAQRCIAADKDSPYVTCDRKIISPAGVLWRSVAYVFLVSALVLVVLAVAVAGNEGAKRRASQGTETIPTAEAPVAKLIEFISEKLQPPDRFKTNAN